MKVFRSRVSTVCVTAAAALGVLAAPAVAGYTCPTPEKQKCNAGRGNGSEGCDPGKSSTSSDGSTGQNQGGDEGGPIRGGTGVS